MGYNENTNDYEEDAKAAIQAMMSKITYLLRHAKGEKTREN